MPNHDWMRHDEPRILPPVKTARRFGLAERALIAVTALSALWCAYEAARFWVF